LTSDNNTCSVTISGVGVGSATISAAAAGYDPVSSAQLEVTSGIIAGNLAILPLSITQLALQESTTLTVQLVGSAKVVTPVVVNLSSSDSNVLAIQPATCSLTTNNNSCTVTINGIGIGSASISAAAAGYDSASSTQLEVTSGIIAGNLAILPLAKNQLDIQESTTLTVQLAGSAKVVTPVAVNLTSSDNTVLTVQPASCSLTSDNNSCNVTIRGKSDGKATITAAASEYASVSSSQVQVVSGAVAGSLVLSPLTTSKIALHESTPLTVTLSGSSKIVAPLTVTLTSSDSNVLTVQPNSCSLTTNNNTCTVTINGISGGSATIMAAAAGYASQTTSTLTVSQLIIAVGSTGSILTSLDGVTWSMQVSPLGTNLSLFSITYGNGTFVATNQDRPIYSRDGKSWYTALTPAASGILYNIAFGNGKFVQLSATQAYLSIDAISWSTVPLTTDNQQNKLCYGNNQFVAVGRYDSSDRSYTSTSVDGSSWTPTLVTGLSGSTGLTDVTWANGLYVAVGSNAAIITSSDGVKWTQRHYTNSGKSFSSVTYGNGRFVAVGPAGVWTSLDGTTWTGPYGPSFTALYGFLGVTYANKKFIAVGYDKTSAIYTSTDGQTWTPLNIYPNLQLNGVTAQN
jgi:hypothetical protein